MAQDYSRKAAGVAAEQAPEVGRNQAEKPNLTITIKKTRQYWRSLGPGLITGAADDDPSGIATYSQAGARFGLQLLWLSWLTFPLMATVLEMCARIGLVTGRGLAANIKRHFPPWVLYLCTLTLVTANIFNIGADLGAMAQASQLIAPRLNFTAALLAFTLLSLGLQIFASYRQYTRYLKWLTLTLFSYLLTALVIPNLNWSAVLTQAISPSIVFSRDQVLIICAVLGTTISPYLFFWQTAQEVKERRLADNHTASSAQASTNNQEIAQMRLDVWSGMLLSNLIMFFIILVTASTLHLNGLTTIDSAASAAEALRPLAGEQAYLLFTLGIIGTGLLAVPILAGSASYALAESFGWQTGLDRQLKQARAFYGIIVVAMIIGVLINFSGLNPMKALFYSAIANGLVAPIALTTIILLSSNRQVMGERVNHPITTAIGWLIVSLIILVGLATIIISWPII